ncbi:MAG: VWA domain-containing protein [Pirellulales bacterium]
MQLSCFYCGNPLSATVEQLGSEVECPHCFKLVRLPEPEELKEEKEASPTLFHSVFHDSVSALLSVIIHAGLLILFAAVTCDHRSGQGEGEEVLLGELPSVDLGDSGGEVLNTTEVESDASDLSDLLEDVSPPSAAPSEEGEMVDISQLLPSGASGGAMSSISTVGGGGGSLAAGASFMGVEAEGSRFCIIADCSGSMSGQKLEFVKQEILETLSSMKREASFQIVFFHSTDLPYPEKGWRSPIRDRQRVTAWLRDDVQAAGGTIPLPAFEVALKFSPRPDAIFFMTDGLFGADLVNQVKQLNTTGGRRVTIHTISFMDKSSEQMMRQIAEDSGGKYRHVSAF